MRRRSWWEGAGGNNRRSSSISQGKRPVQSTDFLLNHPQPDTEDEGNQSDPEAMPSSQANKKRGSWPMLGRKEQGGEGVGDWFKLKWWRKRWREGDEEEGRGRR